MEIFITMLCGSSHPLTVNPHDTVGSLKTSIQDKLGEPAGSQRLVYDNGRGTLLEDDSRSLSSYGLQPGARVSLLVTRPATVQVFLRNEKGQTKTFHVRAEETVKEFRRRVQETEGVPESQQRLIHEGREMMDGQLRDYGVKELSTIYLTLRLRGG
ncbi:ubiquitin-like protein ISG15 [Kryptolebias marmoratus]|uniref:ISG15 ubiquitin like modifier n=1 Tax=Kryptolebias marmoratus TaxID=37003 RepID=A0A3Q3B067_KRYMA|nr:ubiquitin-like protein ISG15 [Kryptolebias marmoratus]